MTTIKENERNNTVNSKKQIEDLYEEMNLRCNVMTNKNHTRISLNGFYEFEPVVKHESKNLDDALHNLQRAFNELVKINNKNSVSLK